MLNKIISLNTKDLSTVSAPTPILTAVFEKGQHFQVGPHTVLNLHGNYHELE